MVQTDARENSPYIVTRRVIAKIHGSLDQMNTSGQDAACWSTQNGRIGDIMGITELLDGTGDQNSSTTLLANCLLNSVKLLEYKNEFPVSLGVNISCVPNKECTRTGHAYAFSTLPDHTNSTPLVLFENETNTQESMSWRQQYPEYTANNLDTYGVLNVQNEGFVFVSKAHPVIQLLRDNAHVLGQDIDQQTLIDDQWFKVTKQTMASCCNKLKTQVLNRVGTVDLNHLQVQIQRLDGMQWIEMSQNDELFSKMPSHVMAQTDANASDADLAQCKKDFTNAYNNLLKKPYAFHARLELQFEVIPTVVDGLE